MFCLVPNYSAALLNGRFSKRMRLPRIVKNFAFAKSNKCMSLRIVSRRWCNQTSGIFDTESTANARGYCVDAERCYCNEQQGRKQSS